MKGSIWRQKDRWVVGWYYPPLKKQVKITRYPRPPYEPLWNKKMAEKCLSLIQGRWEDHLAGKVQFRLEEFTGKGWTDVIEYYESWMREVIEPKRKPATAKGYWSYFNNWIKPFFEQYPVRLNEIRLDTLTKLLNFIKLSGKGKQNVMMALHSMMDYGWRSERIPEMPPFPKREDYNIVEPTIKWLSEDRQMAIIEAIPEGHRSIFLWLKYHLRRPAEACALKWKDWDEINRIFVVKRSISARKMVESTKTLAEHIIPCHDEFYPYMRQLARGNPENDLERQIFINPRARRESGRYTNESLNNLWAKACTEVGESIDLYSGLKHSSCSQYVNEKGLSIYDLRELTDHARLDSVRRYAKVSVARKRELMARSTNKLPKLKVVGENVE